MKAVILDSGPLSLVCNKSNLNIEAIECQIWIDHLLENKWLIILPEIADYETRRELIRAGKVNSVKELDRLKARLKYLPLSTDHMLHAATLWAQVRNQGLPTADRNALDGDVILGAQALSIEPLFNSVIVATTNTVHISRFCKAADWRDIKP